MKITKDEIHEEARQELLVGGYDYLTFAKLAQNLNVTRPALYKHYQSKDELIIELMNAEMQKFLAHLPLVEQNDVVDIVGIILNEFISFADIHRLLENLYRLDYQAKEKFSVQLLELRRAHEVFKDYLDKLISDGKKQEIFREDFPNELIVKFFMNTILMIENKNNQEELEIVKKMLLHGIGAKH